MDKIQTFHTAFVYVKDICSTFTVNKLKIFEIASNTLEKPLKNMVNKSLTW